MTPYRTIPSNEEPVNDQARGLKTERVPIIFIHKYLTQFIPGKQEGYATTTKSLPASY
ncbi:hypothetical protein MAE30S32_43610 [Microcystis aeruginosa 11-30S32]|uniref:Uncharacterized protein n=1 Tax=Microcystis aeruginosa 11-30S32 TaxID=2358142 RepID=A0A510PPT6_MICAE|nr:hypothetical protein MAE30S32_43610 [Microcystis aeruginosa 11-30S32]